ncbi:hypothetical protein FISHEDRAFT_56667 [Fistulina hepatica ATCC 64428]|uniref:F-box domain-containing protein n=1 Tax=Fistulina hepatica ATCC 64428 TaxID=1128425 RepID=A0A0D7AJP6_9AGAR|nr:hypothetical protein FISHEDRAFT_56667 [Fistulina hepatica ATCC 64428]
MSISRVPPEVLADILVQSDPLDVARLSQCCRYLHAVVYAPDALYLWRRLYLSYLDDPRSCVSQTGVWVTISDDSAFWRRRLQSIVSARTTLLRLCSVQQPLFDGRQALQTLVDLLAALPPREWHSAAVPRNVHWFMHELAPLLDFHYVPSSTEVQLYARLQLYHGIAGKLAPDHERRMKARAYVYDLRHYQAETRFGPLLPGGAVNWQHLLEAYLVMIANVQDPFSQVHQAFQDVLDPAVVPFSEMQAPPQIARALGDPVDGDWAGVAGVWRVAFSFCDHTELLSLNHGTLESEIAPLDIGVLADSRFMEVYHDVSISFSVTEVYPDPAHPAHPKLHIWGTFVPSSPEFIIGTVELTVDDQVSGQQGDYTWSTEGIQVGAVGCPFGVLGIWTTTLHDVGDPVGPFWMRRLSPP